MSAVKKINFADNIPKEIAVRDILTPAEVLNLALSSGYEHICQTSHPYFEADMKTSSLMLSHANKFINHPIASILDPDNACAETEKKMTIFETAFDRASQKSSILQAVDATLNNHATSASIRADILVIADELSTNAVFNAPFMDLANTLPGASREDQSIKMLDGKKAKVFLGADSTRLVIGCKDPYGTLNIMKLLERIKKSYDTSVAENMNMTSGGGAGIGSFMVFNSAASYFAAVSAGEYTIVCCVLPVKMSNRARLELPKNLHYIKIKQGE